FAEIESHSANTPRGPESSRMDGIRTRAQFTGYGRYGSISQTLWAPWTPKTRAGANRGYGGENTSERAALLHLHHEERLIVERRGGPLVEILEDGADEVASAAGAVGAHDIGEAAASVLLTGGTQMIRDAVGVEDDGVAGLGLERHLFVFARFEQTD